MTDTTIAAMTSTGKDDWETPPWLFDKLNAEFHFTLDPCCTHQTAKCCKHYTPAENGLAQDWGGEIVFCNPPYSRKTKTNPGQIAWVQKCAEEAQKPNTIVVALLPARTDTELFHRYIAQSMFLLLGGINLQAAQNGYALIAAVSSGCRRQSDGTADV